MPAENPGASIWTIGHSTRSFDEFLSLLRDFQIQTLADVRSFPGSRRFPHFNEAFLLKNLPAAGIAYYSLKALGGRRKTAPDSKNTGWKNEAFRGYADYMQSPEFEAGLSRLQEWAARERVAYMCSESLWWRCHRRLISDRLTCAGWQVWHIMGRDKLELHHLLPPARFAAGILSYPAPEGDVLF